MSGDEEELSCGGSLPECKLCNTPTDNSDLYSCSSCSLSPDSSPLPFDNVTGVCIVCISPHVRRQHNVVDNKGYDVSVCSDHRMINDLFCKTCAQVICSRCTLKHTSHEFLTAAEKCIDVRKEVFSYITKFESLTKGVKFYQQVGKDGIDKVDQASRLCNPNNAVDYLCETVCAYLKEVAVLDVHKDKRRELAAIFKQKIENCAKTCEKINNAVESSDEFVVKLRNDLGTSDGTLIDRFLSKVAQMDDLLETERDILDHHTFYRPFFVDSKKLPEYSRQLMGEFLSCMVWPSLIIMSYSNPTIRRVNFYPQSLSTIVSNANDSFFHGGGFCGKVEQDGGLLKFHYGVCFYDKAKCVLKCNLYSTGFGNYCTNCKKSHLGERVYFSLDRVLMSTSTGSKFSKILPVIPLRGSSNTFLFAIAFENCVEIVRASHASYSKLNEGNVIISEQFPDLNSENILLFFSNPLVGCLMWNETKESIVCTLDQIAFQEIKLDAKPEIFAFSDNLKLAAFVDSLGENITITDNIITTVLTTAYHGLPKIDALHLTKDRNGTNLLFIWNLKRQVCVVMRESIQGVISNWMVVQAFQPQLLNIPDNSDLETGWESVHHTLTHIFLFAYGSNIPWMWSNSTLISLIPTS